MLFKIKKKNILIIKQICLKCNLFDAMISYITVFEETMSNFQHIEKTVTL